MSSANHNSVTVVGGFRVQRVRHELRRRTLSVRRVETISPHVRSVTLGGEELADFVSLSFDDHVKLFLPVADGSPPVARDYTPRHFDAVARELTIEFALHGEGPAAAWAAQARAGQSIGIGGPRGSFIVPTDLDWHLLVATTARCRPSPVGWPNYRSERPYLPLFRCRTQPIAVRYPAPRTFGCNGWTMPGNAWLPFAPCSCPAAKALRGARGRQAAWRPCAACWWTNMAWAATRCAQRPTGNVARRRTTRTWATESGSLAQTACGAYAPNKRLR